MTTVQIATNRKNKLAQIERAMISASLAADAISASKNVMAYILGIKHWAREELDKSLAAEGVIVEP